MKCEICHKADAEVAITRGEGDGEEELYVCRACAAAERTRRQKKSQRTRKIQGLPPGMSISVSGNMENPPPFISAIMDAMSGIVNDMEKAEQEKSAQRRAKKKYVFPVARVDRPFRYGGRLHLEGLHLIGELEAVHRAMRALRIRLVPVEADGVKGAGHAYAVEYAGSSEQAKRIVESLVLQERNARIRLVEEMPRVFGDSICRALAILKNCRLLSPGELFDLLSPMRLAAIEGLLEGTSVQEIETLAEGLDLSGSEDKLDQAERDKVDAARADEMNRLFEDVVLNEEAEGKV